MDTTTLHIHLQTRTPHYIFMNSFSSKLNRINIKTLCTSTATAAAATSTSSSSSSSSSSTVKPKTPRLTKPAKITSAAALQFKQNWLDSLTFPPLDDSTPAQTPNKNDPDSKWVIGIDPDLSGALAVLKTDDSGCSALVYDSPRVPILIGGKVRKRLDVKSIIQLLRSLDAPLGTSAYIEQSVPYPKDGKQGWWSGGFGYGLWIGVLVASGFSVIPVPTIIWKNEFELYGGTVTKDDSRRVASTLFPSLSSQLKRKKDHGRAEALLIAAYGNGLKKSDLPCLSPDDLLPSTSGNL